MGAKTYLLVGLTGSGKSTTGNCIINKSGDLKSILYNPFRTSDSSSGCTKSFTLAGNSERLVLDTIGFGDPQFEPTVAFNELRAALKRVNNQVDCVLFVAKKSRFTKELTEFFEIMQEKVLKGTCRANSILLITDCNKGWLQRPEQAANRYIQKALDNTNRLNYEFSLKFDDTYDEADESAKEKNYNKRQKAIDELISFLDQRSFNKIDLSYVQTPEFERTVREELTPKFSTLYAFMKLSSMFG